MAQSTGLVTLTAGSVAEFNKAVATVNAATDASTSYEIKLTADIALGEQAGASGPSALTTINSIAPVTVDGAASANGKCYAIDGGNGGDQQSQNHPSCGLVVNAGLVTISNLIIRNVTSAGSAGSMGAGGALFVANLYDINVPGAPSGNPRNIKYGNGKLIAAATAVTLNNVSFENAFALGSDGGWSNDSNGQEMSGTGLVNNVSGIGYGGQGGTDNESPGNGGDSGFGGSGGGGANIVYGGGTGGNGGFGGGGGGGGAGGYAPSASGCVGGAEGFGGGGGGGGCAGGGTFYRFHLVPITYPIGVGGAGGGQDGGQPSGTTGGKGAGPLGGGGGTMGNRRAGGGGGASGGGAGFGGAIFVMSGASLKIDGGLSFDGCYATDAGHDIFFQGNGTLDQLTKQVLRGMIVQSNVCDETFAIQHGYVTTGLTPEGQNPALGPDGLPTTGGSGDWGISRSYMWTQEGGFGSD